MPSGCSRPPGCCGSTSCTTGSRGCNGAGGGAPGGPQAPMGGVDPPGLRSRPPHPSSLRKRDARDRLHYPTRGHRPHPRSPPKARQGLSPASALRAASGHPRLRSAPCAQALTLALGVHFTEGPSESWPSRWPRSPRHRPSPAAPTPQAVARRPRKGSSYPSGVDQHPVPDRGSTGGATPGRQARLSVRPSSPRSRRAGRPRTRRASGPCPSGPQRR